MIRTTVAIECDSCGTRQHSRVPAVTRSRPSTVRDLRRRLNAIGWSRGPVFTNGPTGDLCPRCSS